MPAVRVARRRMLEAGRAATGAALVVLSGALFACTAQVADPSQPSEPDAAVDDRDVRGAGAPARGTLAVAKGGGNGPGDDESGDVADMRGGVVGEPVGVRIPAIDVDAVLVPVGLNADRSMQVPDFGLAGWYTEGPRPGEPGPSVIVAHYDSRSGPDVFFDLATLEPGDEIHVQDENGSEVTFSVESLEQRPKGELPTERIWAVSSHPRLTLVTCGGVFDRETGHYLDNVIVYAVEA